MATLNYILFPIPSTLATQYQGIEHSGLLSGNNLIVRASMEDYVPLGIATNEVTQGYTSPIVLVHLRAIGFDVTWREGRDAGWEILENLRQLQEATPGIFTPTTALDFIRPDYADRVQGFTTRRGQLSVSPLGGTFMGTGGSRLHAGLTVTLTPI